MDRLSPGARRGDAHRRDQVARRHRRAHPPRVEAARRDGRRGRHRRDARDRRPRAAARGDRGGEPRARGARLDVARRPRPRVRRSRSSSPRPWKSRRRRPIASSSSVARSSRDPSSRRSARASRISTRATIASAGSGFPKVGGYVGVDASPANPMFGMLGLAIELPVAQRNRARARSRRPPARPRWSARSCRPGASSAR